jgi:hypothetical protein
MRTKRMVAAPLGIEDVGELHADGAAVKTPRRLRRFPGDFEFGNDRMLEKPQRIEVRQ